MLARSLSALCEEMGPDLGPDSQGPHWDGHQATCLLTRRSLRAVTHPRVPGKGGPSWESPGARESPALPARPLQDVTSSPEGRLGPRPAD